MRKHIKRYTQTSHNGLAANTVSQLALLDINAEPAAYGEEKQAEMIQLLSSRSELNLSEEPELGPLPPVDLRQVLRYLRENEHGELVYLA